MQSIMMTPLLEISRYTAQVFVSGLWQGVVLISFVALCLRLLSRVSASVRFAVWGFAFALVGAVPLLHFHMPNVRQAYASSAVVHLGAQWQFAIAVIWIVLMAARAVQLLMQSIQLHRIWKRAKPVTVDNSMLTLLQNGRRVTELCISSDVDSPSVIGFFSPRLLIPDWLFAKLTEFELQQIVLHECEHLRRCDDWMNLLQKIGLTLFPLNPALLWVDRRLSLERELACDAGVVASTAAPFDYANCLTRLAEHRIRCRRVALSLSAWSRQSELARRVHNLLQPMDKMFSLQARVSIALLSLGLVAGAVEMARVPTLVAFTDAVSVPMKQAVAPVSDTTAMRALPVVYRQAEHPHPTLLKAVMPSSNPSHIFPSKKRTTNQQQQTELRSAHTVRAVQPPHIMLTTATQSAAKRHNRPLHTDGVARIYTISTEFSSSYAAVPFGDGWLIVQL